LSTLNVTRTRDRPPPGQVHLILPVDLRPLLGTWVNYDHTSSGIRRLHIEDWEGTPVVRVFGAALPEPIDWGEVAGAAFTTGVDAREAVAFTAVYHLEFARVMLAAYLNKRLLVVDAYTAFTDHSGRAAYFQRDHLYLP
jgi:hypothetical protein